MVRVLRPAALVALSSLAVVAIAAAPSRARATGFHNHLVKSAPAADEQLAASPKAVTLWFSEKPEVPVSTIAIVGADSSKAALGKVEAVANEANAVTVAVTKPLAKGTYTVQWKTGGSDGHPSRGKFAFTVK